MRIVRDQTDRAETPRLICHAVVEGFGFARCAIAIVDHASRMLVPIAAHDGRSFVADGGLLTVYRIPLDPAPDGRYETAAWCVARDRQSHVASMEEQPSREIRRATQLERLLDADDYIITPIRDHGRVVAVLAVDRKGQEPRLSRQDAATLEDICALLSIRAAPCLPIQTVDAAAADPQQVVHSPDLIGPLLAAIDRAILLAGPDGRIAWANTMASAMTGSFPWDLAGTALQDRLVIDGEIDDAAVTAMQHWRTGRLRRSNGEDRIVDVQVVATGRHRVFIVRDDTGESDAARSDATLAMLVHDMKGPLQGIIGNTELLMAGRFGALAADQHAAITRIGENSEYVLDLANRIQCASDLDETLIKPEPVDMAAVIERIIARMEGKAASRGIRLDAAVQSDLALVCGDEFHLAEALQNLVDNALNACSARGTVRICANTIPRGLARFDVAGRDCTDAPTDRNTAAVPPARRLFHGLGLSIARRIATAHGGRLWAESAGERAMTVSFTVPLWTETRTPRSKGNGKTTHPRN
jgi:signal transduction histidine kinase